MFWSAALALVVAALFWMNARKQSDPARGLTLRRVAAALALAALVMAALAIYDRGNEPTADLPPEMPPEGVAA